MISIDMNFLDFLGWLQSSGAGNLGSLLGGISACVLGGVGFFASTQFWGWRRQKRLEKTSVWAEETLILFESFLEQVDDWFLKISVTPPDDHCRDFFKSISPSLSKTSVHAKRLSNQELDRLFRRIAELIRPAPGNLRKVSDKNVDQYMFPLKGRIKAQKYLDSTPEKIRSLGDSVKVHLLTIMLMES